MTKNDMSPQEQRMFEQGYLTAATAAEKLGIHVATIYRLVKTGKLREVGIGTRSYIHVDSMVDYAGLEGSVALGIITAEGASVLAAQKAAATEK